MELFFFIAETVLPVFVIIVLGYVLFRWKVVSEDFARAASQLVFTIALPCLVYKEIANANIAAIINLPYILFIYSTTLASVIAAWLLAKYAGYAPRQTGAFVQGSFRGNFAIVGIAILANTGDKQVMAQGALTLAFILPFYNILSVAVLTLPHKGAGKTGWTEILRIIYTNPLIIALVIGLLVNSTGFAMPQVLNKSINYVSAMAMPLALIGVGATLAAGSMSRIPLSAYLASVLKIAVFPAVLTIIAILAGYTGTVLLVLFVLFASPTAIVSYIMAEAMNGDGPLAGAIILISTMFSVITISAGLIILKWCALI